jgi:hypothetical protein
VGVTVYAIRTRFPTVNAVWVLLKLVVKVSEPVLTRFDVLLVRPP